MTSSHWQELPQKFGRDAWELRLCDDHWYRVFGTRVVLCPNGIGHGVYGSVEEAKRAAERMYRDNLNGMLKRAGRLTSMANIGLAMLDGR